MKLKDLFDKLLFFTMSLFLSMDEICDLDAEYLESNAVIQELYNRPILPWSICGENSNNQLR